jgi:hypothetical protein
MSTHSSENTCNASFRTEPVTPRLSNNYTRKNKESVSLIWFDPSVNTTDDSKTTLEVLRSVNDFFLYFTECTPCVDYIKSIANNKIFLIVSGKSAYELLPKIISYRQVDTVFIFCANKNRYQRLLEDFPKVVDIVNSRNDLLASINRHINLVNKQIATFDFYEQHQQATCDLSKELAKFLW